MINKLKNKIFWILQISLSVLVLVIIIMFLVINYRNTNSTISRLMLRYDDVGMKEESKEKTDTTSAEYYVLEVKNSKITKNEKNADESIQNLAIKACKSSNTEGMVGNYMYKYKKVGDNAYTVTLVENTSIAMQIKTLFVFSFLFMILVMVVIYFISKKIAVIIVKPVEETLDKQKQFISDASHELKTPLSIIEVNAEVAEEKLGDNKYITYIRQEAESMDKLINDMLLLAKFENVQNVQNYDEFDMSSEIEIIIATFEIMATEKKVTIERKIKENIKIVGSKEDIKYILSTLLDNAIKHTESGKKVIIELSKEKGEIVLQVKNEGEPIPDEEKDKIFERFYRIDKSRNREEKRYGLGLAIAKSITEKYNGKIEVISSNGITNFKVRMTSK